MKIFDKYKYKIWKHLTKAFFPDHIAAWICSQYGYSSLEKRRQKLVHYDKKNNQSHAPLPNPIIAISGYYGSGSSALVGLLSEFKGASGIGFSQAHDFGEKGREEHLGGSESNLLRHSNFFALIESFFDGSSPEEIDAHIRRFLVIFNRYLTEGFVHGMDDDDLINHKAIMLMYNFICNILGLKDDPHDFLHSGFPVILPQLLEDNSMDDMPFIRGNGKIRYLFYAPRKIQREELDALAVQFLQDFFRLIPGDIIIHDQMTPFDILEKINHYLPGAVKQICVRRDPRDQYMSCVRDDISPSEPWSYMPRDVEGYAKFYMKLWQAYDYSYPGRMVVRFEDLVLKRKETLQKICDFVGVDISQWVAPSTSFIPEDSVKNLGVYRIYHNQNIIKEIESRLHDFCYYPEKENLSPEARLLLKNSGNWDDSEI